MELREFITTTLKEITKGVTQAQIDLASLNKAGAGSGPAINPKTLDQIKVVDFDIAVTVSETAGGKVAGKAGISVVGASGEMSQENSHSKVSRIKFQVPIRFGNLHI